jgi:hypothetical protein
MPVVSKMLHNYLFLKVFFQLNPKSTNLRTHFNINLFPFWGEELSLEVCLTNLDTSYLVGVGVMRSSSSALGKQENKWKA